MPLSNVKPEQYQELLETKVSQLVLKFADFYEGEIATFTSPPTGFRMRAEFRIWHDGDNLDYVMFRKEAPKDPVAIHEFPIADLSIQTLMPELKRHLIISNTLRRKLFQVEFLSSLRGDRLVSLIYHRALDDDWIAAATELANALDIKIIGRSRKQKCVIGDPWVTESLTVDGNSYEYRQPEGAFTQPNAHVNRAMIHWARDCANECTGDLLELYCGIGNFTLPLAEKFNAVLATELSKSATAAAQHNRAVNNANNVAFARLSAEEMTSALNGDRVFRRLADLPQSLSEYDLRTLLVDPPRAGLDAQTTTLAERFDRIIYISCNPETLLANLQLLHASHDVSRLAFFDQFPYTDHMECGVLLTRRA